MPHRGQCTWYPAINCQKPPQQLPADKLEAASQVTGHTQKADISRILVRSISFRDSNFGLTAASAADMPSCCFFFLLHLILVGTLMLEGLFSAERRRFDKSKSAARFDDVMYWDRAVITDLRGVRRAAGEEGRSLSRARRESRQLGPVKQAMEQSASDWCSNYGQVHAA